MILCLNEKESCVLGVAKSDEIAGSMVIVAQEKR